MDERKKIFLERFAKLSTPAIKRIRENIDRVCFDTFNYDEKTNTYCPIAIALGLDLSVDNPTDEKVREKISEYFQPANALKGVPGRFYTSDRVGDLLTVCYEILINRL